MLKGCDGAETVAEHLKADAPVAAYSVYPYGGAASTYPTATLLLPVSSWEKSYIAVAPYDFAAATWPRTLQIVASEDGTKVQMTPTVQVVAGSGVEGGTRFTRPST